MRAKFTDQLHFSNALPDSDFLPGDLLLWCHEAHAGDRLHTRTSTVQSIPDYNQDHRLTLDRKTATAAAWPLGFVYPGRFIEVAKLPASFRINAPPTAFARIVTAARGQLTLDFNHPLAGKIADVDLAFNAIQLDSDFAPRPLDIASVIRQSGFGLQDAKVWPLPAESQAAALVRVDPREDEVFFARPEMNPFWDKAANLEIAHAYRGLIADGVRILDLMAGVHSPLQESSIDPAAMVCAGLNPTELSHNPLCSRYDVYNVNSRLALPYATAAFDVVLIHAAIEYLTQPDFIFREIARVLTPGGRIIVTFSDRSVDAKSIALWRDLHRLERSALIVDYLKGAGRFTNLNGESVSWFDANQGSNLPRSPVCTVWAERDSLPI